MILSYSGYSQGQLDFGEVQGNNIHTCNPKNGGKVCKSKNEFEISLTRARVIAGKYETVTLIYNNSKWQAYKYEGDWIHDFIAKFKLTPISTFEQIFSDLKTNKVFTLPDQKDLQYESTVDDGTEYVLTFKAQNQFRTYRFEILKFTLNAIKLYKSSIIP